MPVVVLLVVSAATSSAQTSSPSGPEPAFEVASVKPNRSGATNSSSNTRPGGGYLATNLSLRQLIVDAYEVRPFQIASGPGWIDSDRFDITAKAPEGTRTPYRTMLRTLLAERFKLRLRSETRQQPIHALVLARADGRLGSKLTPSTLECTPGPPPPSQPPPPSPCGMNTSMSGTSGVLKARGQPLSRLANVLASFIVDQMVVDRTGLTGNFDFELQWTPDNLRSTGPAATGDGPSLFTALQEQLGLKLESSRGPVEHLVIDAAAPPTPD